MYDDMNTILAIVERAEKMAAEVGTKIDRLTYYMDIDNAHKHCPLNLGALLAADDFNFAHDVFGIHGHMDRTTGKLSGGFLPRYAASQHANAGG